MQSGVPSTHNNMESLDDQNQGLDAVKVERVRNSPLVERHAK